MESPLRVGRPVVRSIVLMIQVTFEQSSGGISDSEVNRGCFPRVGQRPECRDSLRKTALELELREKVDKFFCVSHSLIVDSTAAPCRMMAVEISGYDKHCWFLRQAAFPL